MQNAQWEFWEEKSKTLGPKPIIKTTKQVMQKNGQKIMEKHQVWKKAFLATTTTHCKIGLA
jgi:hypothetical protein